MYIKKRFLTLLEMMVVIFLIGLIGSVVGYNVKGAIDKAKKFKTEQAMNQIYDALMLQVAEGISIDEVIGNPEEYLKRSPFIKDPERIILDGWGERFEIKKTHQGENLLISSKTYSRIMAKETRKPQKEQREYEE